MEEIYKISTRTNKQRTRHTLLGATGRSTLRLLMTICLLGLLVQVSARPSDAATKPVAINDDHASTVSAPHHSAKRRSADDPDEDVVDEHYHQYVKRCYDDEDINELCQRCSKVTKAPSVFPMCCSNEDQTMDWCKAYVYYGIQN